MSPASEVLKTTEAAVVSRVGLRDVNRVIDEGILPNGCFGLDDGRYVIASACTLIYFYFNSAAFLTSEERQFAIHIAEPRLRKSASAAMSALLKEDWIIRHEFLTIDFQPFVQGVVDQLDKLVATRDMVISSKDYLNGMPVIRGTRVPVYDVAANVNSGVSLEEILDGYPTINARQVELAKMYADAYPPRGRPRAPTQLPPGAIVLSDRRVPRRKKLE